MEQNLREAISSKYPEASPERFTVRESGIEAKSLEIDIFVKSVNKGIEFNGRYWHSPEQLRKRFPKWTQESVDRYHEIKQEYFRSIGIEILFIEEKEWRTNKEEQIQKALSFLAVTNG